MKWLPLLLALLTPLVSFGQQYTLDDAIQQALAANYEYLQLADQVALARMNYEEARSVFETQFGASSSSDARLGAETGSYYSFFMKKKNPSGSAFTAGIYNSSYGERTLSELRFSYILPFFNNSADQDKLRINQTEVDLDAKRRMRDIGREELIDRVITTYYQVLLAQQSQSLAEAGHAIAKRQQKARQLAADHGELTELELVKGELSLARSEQDLKTSEFRASQQVDRFKILLGLDFSEPLSLAPPEDAPVDDSLLNRPLGYLEELAMGQRVELIALREGLDITEQKLRAARDSDLPPVEVSLHYALVGDGHGLDESFDFNDHRVGIGIRMNTDFGNTKQNTHLSRLNIQYASDSRRLERQESQVRLEVREAMFNARQKQDLLALAARRVHLAERQLTQSRILHDGGDLSRLDLIQMEIELAESRHDMLVTQTDFLLAAQQLAKATGQYNRQWRY